ncbi:MAG TPA: ATP-binding protein, partial [Panacibacter sp.]|nr:ATP-binding protein [Panacibacter sp.]
ARTIAHEVKNPLTNINLAAEQLKELVAPGQESDMLFDMMVRNGNRINQLVSDLLNSTKVSELKVNTVSINELLDEALERAKDRIELTNVKVEKNYTPGTCNVSVDKEQIKIAFLNLIVNAVEATEPGTGKLNLKTENRFNKCVVTIADNGKGIEEEDLQKLFEPYFTGKPKGTGLGLTHTQTIILNHKGSIYVDSKPGKGTTFEITLDFA